ncbi:hypothetical protein LIER_41794 [Lithospermum erythrorhizon]|uniref:Uncharacterized protein n=1 Tax=Lithospermum erythrorhizon TaxID=34254 RepID=A0AAV3RI91_LITER
MSFKYVFTKFIKSAPVFLPTAFEATIYYFQQKNDDRRCEAVLKGIEEHKKILEITNCHLMETNDALKQLNETIALLSKDHSASLPKPSLVLINGMRDLDIWHLT